MLVAIEKVTPVDGDTVLVSWTSAAVQLVSWVFVNGAQVATAIVSSALERSAVVALPFDKTAVLEVQDLPAGVVAKSINVPPNMYPKIRWARARGAARYRVYHRIEGDLEDTLIHDDEAFATQERYELASPIELAGQGGKWHFLRVESVDPQGNESERLSFPYFAMEPPAPVTLTVAPGAGANLFNITIGA